MKLNGNTVKVVLAFVVIVAVTLWAATSVLSRSYSGPQLSFDTGASITITNLSDNPAAVQLTGTGSRTFRVASTTEGMTGSSTTTGTGSTRTQQFEFELPPGSSEFTVSGGTNVRFVSDTATALQATVHPMSNESRLATLIAAAGVIFAALFYASNVTEHQWIKSLRHRVLPSHPATSKQDAETPPVIDSSQGRSTRSYGDNRTKR